MNGDGDGDAARKGTGVEAIEETKNGNVDGSGNRAGTETGTGVETRRRTQDGNEAGSGYGNESSSGDGNGDEDGNEDGDEDGIEESGGGVNKHKKPHNSCRCDVDNEGDSGVTRKNVNKKGLVQ